MTKKGYESEKVLQALYAYEWNLEGAESYLLEEVRESHNELLSILKSHQGHSNDPNMLKKIKVIQHLMGNLRHEHEHEHGHVHEHEHAHVHNLEESENSLTGFNANQQQPMSFNTGGTFENENIFPTAKNDKPPHQAPREEPVNPPTQESVKPPTEKSDTEKPANSFVEELVKPPTEEPIRPPTEEPVKSPTEEAVNPPTEVTNPNIVDGPEVSQDDNTEVKSEQEKPTKKSKHEPMKPKGGFSRGGSKFCNRGAHDEGNVLITLDSDD